MKQTCSHTCAGFYSAIRWLTDGRWLGDGDDSKMATKNLPDGVAMAARSWRCRARTAKWRAATERWLVRSMAELKLRREWRLDGRLPVWNQRAALRPEVELSREIRYMEQRPTYQQCGFAYSVSAMTTAMQWTLAPRIRTVVRYWRRTHTIRALGLENGPRGCNVEGPCRRIIGDRRETLSLRKLANFTHLRLTTSKGGPWLGATSRMVPRTTIKMPQSCPRFGDDDAER